MNSCKHPLWAETDLSCGLRSFNDARAKLQNVSKSPLQVELLRIAGSWYSNSTSIYTAEKEFLSAIANLSQKYSNETDLLAWYGLSLLNVAKQNIYDSQIQPEAMLTARNILELAFKRESQHPGVLHYLIHAYDVPLVDIAEMAREYAMMYGVHVATSSHSQHMASHIWLRTGIASFVSWSVLMLYFRLLVTCALFRHSGNSRQFRIVPHQNDQRNPISQLNKA